MSKISIVTRGVSFCLAAALAVSGLSGCSSESRSEVGSGSQEELQSEELAGYNHNEDEHSNLGSWGRAMGSVLLIMNEGSPYYFGGYEATEANQKAAAEILEQSWSVTDRSELLSQIRILTETGARKDFRQEAREMNRMSKKELKRAMKQLSGSLLVHYELIEYNWDKWQKKSLLAWDLCRVSHLAQWGYIAGYLSRDEAQAVLEPAAKKLQKNFSGWDDVQNNWLDGYAYYANIDMSQAGNNYEKRKQVYEQIKEEQAEKGLLYDDALFREEVIALEQVSYSQLWKELEQSGNEKSSDKKKNKKSGKTQEESSDKSGSEDNKE